MPNYRGKSILVTVSRAAGAARDRVVLYDHDPADGGYALVLEDASGRVRTADGSVIEPTQEQFLRVYDLYGLFPSMRDGSLTTTYNRQHNDAVSSRVAALKNLIGYPVIIPHEVTQQVPDGFYLAYLGQAGQTTVRIRYDIKGGSRNVQSFDTPAMFYNLHPTPQSVTDSPGTSLLWTFAERNAIVTKANESGNSGIFVLTNPGQRDTDGFTQPKVASAVIPGGETPTETRIAKFQVLKHDYRGPRPQREVVQAGGVTVTLPSQPARTRLTGTMTGVDLTEFRGHSFLVDGVPYDLGLFEHDNGLNYRVTLSRDHTETGG